eukprot:comp20853_c0_seq1/m.27585 comp20853_c0_seq1/g.27585  ORF comp20853_c0_seq1/g.27585 comp20853_c0_seq1/m.27585 type:complete len:340 (-) comp20853_c0_seq1:256-1275(-)
MNAIQQVALGKAGLRVSRQGLGCMGMTAFYVKSSAEHEVESLATVDEALRLGVNFLDTAFVYRSPLGERNEELVGKAIKGRREKFIVATKFGIEFRDGQMVLDSSRENVRRSCEDSLKVLGTDYIDLYYQHRVDPKVPIEETMAELKLLVEEGKIHHIGLSEVSASNLRRAHAIHPISAIQMEWSLWSRDIEREVVPTARELGVGIVAYSPLGRGMLTGALNRENFAPNDSRRAHPRFNDENFEANLQMVKNLEAIAQRLNATTGQLALAWVQSRGEDVVPIPGTKNPRRLQENVGVLALLDKLAPEILAEIEVAVPWDKIKGDRYPAHMMQTTHLGQL